MPHAASSSRRPLWALLWAGPCTLVGLLLGLLARTSGGPVKRVDGVWEFAWGERGLGAWLAQRLPFAAITLGHVVVARTPQLLQRWRTHEHAHVAQYERWGLVFFLAYPMASLWAWLLGREAYWDNVFERQARRAEASAEAHSRTSRGPR